LKTKRTVALLHYSAWPSIGGVETVLRQQAELMAADGFEVRILVGFGRTFSDLISVCSIEELNGADPAVMAAQQEALRGEPGPAFDSVTSRLRSRLEPIFAGCEVIIAHNYLTMPFNLAATKVLSDFAREQFPVIAWTHDLAALNVDYDVPYNPITDLLRQKLTGAFYVTISELRAREFRTLTGHDPDQTIPNGIDFAKVCGLPASIESALGTGWCQEVILFYPARLVRRKNIEFAIEIMAALSELGSPVRLIISGSSNSFTPDRYLQELKILAASRGVQDRMVWANEHCQIDEPCLRALYLAADALLFSTRQEGFGLPLFEAVALRLPVFCSNIEPLRSLAPSMATVFDLNTSPVNIAKIIRDTLDRDEVFRSRKELLRRYSASRLYSERIKPLLWRKQ
jgi:mannosylglucosylglycerate synthase